jgi:hypothetical protein
MMKNLITKYELTHCKKCKENTVDLYDVFNRKVNYPFLLKNFTPEVIMDRLDNVSLSHMYCSNCKTTFLIDWRYGLPIPYMDEMEEIK